MPYIKSQKGKNGLNSNEAAQYLGMTYSTFRIRRMEGVIAPPTTDQGGGRLYYSQEQLDLMKTQLEKYKAQKASEKSPGYNNTKAAQYLGLTYYEFQCLLHQGEIEQPTTNNGGIRNFYTQEQLDRIKQQLTNNGGK